MNDTNTSSTVPRYTTSFPVQTQFVSNNDHVGDCLFTQIHRQGDLAIYRRDKIETGKVFGYEVVRLSTVKAGTPLPGGNVVEKDYEQYPGAQAFGRKGWFCVTPEQAQARLNLLLNNVPTELEIPVLHVSVTQEPVTKTVKTTVTSLIPDGEFTQSQFAVKNGLPERGTVYNVLKGLIDNRMVKVARQVKMGPGRPTNVYSKV